MELLEKCLDYFFEKQKRGEVQAAPVLPPLQGAGPYRERVEADTRGTP